MENNTIVDNSSQNEELEWARYTFICLMSLVTIIGVPGNSIVLAVLIKQKDKGSTDYLILTMCVTDLISSSINSPLHIFRYQPSIWEKIASSELCRLHIFLICSTIISTTSLLAATAYDRLRKTKNKSVRDTFQVIRKSKYLCIGVISSSIIYGTIYMLTMTLDTTSLKCVHITKYKTMATSFSCILALLFIFMFVITVIAYTKITIILRRHHLQLFQHQQTTVNMHSMPKHKYWNRKIRIQPIINLPSTSNRNVSDVSNACNSNISFVTISTKTQDEHDFKPSESATSKQIDVVSQENDEPSKSKRPKVNVHTIVNADRNRKKINTTSLMMFIITLIYITTWVINWSTQIYKVATSTRSLKTDFLTERLYMILCVTNPLFYIFMSSKFRIKAKEMFFK